MGGGGGGWGEGAKQKMVYDYKQEPSQNSCTQDIVFVTIYFSKQKDYS